jgi:YD repeat-containing protein
VTKYTYDANDQMLTIVDSRGNAALTNVYNSDGRVIQQTMADGSQFAFAYTEDANGDVIETQVTDPRGNQRDLFFSPSGYFTGGKLISETRAVGKPEQQTYTYTWQSSTGLLQSITDPLNRTTSYAYDSNGNLTSTTFLSGTSNAVTVSATYNPTFNEVASVTDPMGRAANFSYDASGNLTTIAKPLNLSVSNTFNSQGQLLSSTPAGTGAISLGYTAGLPSSVTNSLSSQATLTYDTSGRVTTVGDPLGNTTSYQYDADNRPLIATDALQNRTQFSYDADRDGRGRRSYDVRLRQA